MSQVEKLGHEVAMFSRSIVQAGGVEQKAIHGRALAISTVFDPWKVLTFIVTCFVCILLFHFLYRTFIHYKWNLGYSQHSAHPQLDDERNVIELPIAGLGQQQDIEIRRLERRQKFEQFLAPYTMVIQNEQFFYSVDTRGRREFYPMDEYIPDHEAECRKITGNREVNSTEVDIEDVDCSSLQRNLNSNQEIVIKIKAAANGQPRYVDSSCSICLLDYEVGNVIIRSSRRVCRHAFHRDCILVWLGNGKKRCPVCRNFFVPRSKIDDRQVITHDPNDLEASINDTGNLGAHDDHQEREKDRFDPLAITTADLDEHRADVTHTPQYSFDYLASQSM